MNRDTMTPMERVLTTLSHKEADRVPFFLFPTLHGAKELKLSIKEYFSQPSNVFEGQMILREKYRHDCLYGFYYGPAEIEPWGGEVIFIENGPPNSGRPFLQSTTDIEKMPVPNISDHSGLQRVLKTIEMMKEEVKDEVPIIGVAISPFSLPVMQMGFDNYIDLILNNEKNFWKLMAVNQKFCIAWANAQVEAGATAICYFDPLSSPTMVPRNLYLKTGYKIAKDTIAEIKSATAIHMASGLSLPIAADKLIETGTGAIGVSTDEPLTELKAAYKNKLTVIGNLNGIEMRRWNAAETEKKVKTAIQQAGEGGGFILSDHHGEIPYQVPDKVLKNISDAVFKYGYYPVNKEL
ncbi:MAG: uroporphyrinogen decarboxylase family protein [Fidelibacterota bacterium]